VARLTTPGVAVLVENEAGVAALNVRWACPPPFEVPAPPNAASHRVSVFADDRLQAVAIQAREARPARASPG